MVYALTPDEVKLSDRVIEFQAKKSLLNRLLTRLDEEMPTRSRMVSIMRRKILSKVQVARGSGETTGSQWHMIEMDAISERAHGLVPDGGSAAGGSDNAWQASHVQLDGGRERVGS